MLEIGSRTEVSDRYWMQCGGLSQRRLLWTTQTSAVIYKLWPDHRTSCIMRAETATTMHLTGSWRATQAKFKYVDDLATVWCEWAEMELRHKNFKRALDLMRRATVPPARAGPRRSQEEMQGPVQGRLYRRCAVRCPQPG